MRVTGKGLVVEEGPGRELVARRGVGFSIEEAACFGEQVRRMFVEGAGRRKQRVVRVPKPLKVVVRLELPAEVAAARALSKQLGTPDKAEWAEIFKGVLLAWMEGRYDS